MSFSGYKSENLNRMVIFKVWVSLQLKRNYLSAKFTCGEIQYSLHFAFTSYIKAMTMLLWSSLLGVQLCVWLWLCYCWSHCWVFSCVSDFDHATVYCKVYSCCILKVVYSFSKCWGMHNGFFFNPRHIKTLTTSVNEETLKLGRAAFRPTDGKCWSVRH